MTQHYALTPLDPADYHAIEAAVMETARGRWFLAEFAKRNRNADTDVLLGAIDRLEKTLVVNKPNQQFEQVRFDLEEMAKVIERTKDEIAALRPDGDSIRQFEEAAIALDSIVQTTEKATSDILEAAESIQEAAWTLRELGADSDQCDIIDRRATDIYTACSFQDLTAQRTRKVVGTLTYLEERINTMIDVWQAGKVAEVAPFERQAPEPIFNPGLSQSDIDLVVEDDTGMFEAVEVIADGAPGADDAPVAPQAMQADMDATWDEPPASMPSALPSAIDFDRASLSQPIPSAAAMEDDLVFVDNPAPDEALGTQAPAADTPPDAGPDPLAAFDAQQGAAVPPADQGPDPLAEIDALAPEERLRRFT